MVSKGSRPANDMPRGNRRGWVGRLGLASALPSLALVVVGGILEAHGHVRTGGMAAVVGIVTTLLGVGVHRRRATGSGMPR